MNFASSNSIPSRINKYLNILSLRKMKFNSSILFYFFFVFMTMLIRAQAQAQDEGCKVKVYSPRQGSIYQFYSRQSINYSVSDECFTGSYLNPFNSWVPFIFFLSIHFSKLTDFFVVLIGRRNRIDVGIISRSTGENVYDVVRNGYVSINLF